MKKILLIIFILTSMLSTSFAQRAKFFGQLGFSDVGFNQWYQTALDITAGFLIPAGPTVSLGGFLTTGGSPKYFYYTDGPYSAKAKALELGLLSRYTAFRNTKFEVYGQNTISRLSVSYEGDTGFGTPSIPQTGSASAFGVGAGAGFVYKIKPNIQINMFEIDVTFINLKITDRKIHKDFKTGIIFQFDKAK